MPSFVKALKEEERWQLANFIKSLQHELTDHQVLKALRIEGDLPETPGDPAWSQAEAMDVRLTGQVVAAPRWQNPSIELATLEAVFNDAEIAFRITWDDPFKDVVHDPDQEFDPAEIANPGAFNSYVAANDMVPRQLETFRDSIALQFPIKEPEGTKKPHFLRGGGSDPVNLWIWQADRDAAGEPAAVEALARGWKQSAKAQPEDQQQVTAKAAWDQGRWSIVMKRPLETGDKNDVRFPQGVFVPMSLNAWDGSNGEHGRIMSLSTWYYVFLEAPAPMKIYAYAGLAVLIVGGIGFRLMRWAEKEDAGEAGA
jgi:DMSO reductase family type II enzyme heme b subunit